METLRLVLVFGHLLGTASLLGGAMVQMTASERRILPAMVQGALTQAVTGVLLVLVRGDAPPVDDAKVGVKAAVLLVILGLIWANRGRAKVSEGVYMAIGGLTVLNVAVAVFWT